MNYYPGLCFILLLFFWGGNQLQAAGLKDFDESGQMNLLDYQTNKGGRQLYSCSWGEERTNYWRLFCGKAGVDILADWLNLRSINYKCGGPTKKTTHAWVEMSRICQTPAGQRIETVVMIPHPRHVVQVEAGLIKEFNQLEPPSLPVESSESSSVQGFPARIYHKRNGTCSILVKLAKGAVFNMAGRCEAVEHMKKLGEDLTLDTLDKKLRS